MVKKKEFLKKIPVFTNKRTGQMSVVIPKKLLLPKTYPKFVDIKIRNK